MTDGGSLTVDWLAVEVVALAAHDGVTPDAAVAPF